MKELNLQDKCTFCINGEEAINEMKSIVELAILEA